MKLWKALAPLCACLLLAGCNADNLGFPIGDVRGLWFATTYQVTDSGSGLQTLSLIAAGGQLAMTIDDGATGGVVVAVTFEDGSGGGWQGGGVVDVRAATMTIDGATYAVDHDRNDMTLVSAATSFDFGTGEEPASALIELRRF